MSRIRRLFSWRESPFTYRVSKINTLSYINRKLVPILVQKLPTDPWNNHGNKDGRCFGNIFMARIENLSSHRYLRGTQREYSSKPLKHSIVKRILVFKR